MVAAEINTIHMANKKVPDTNPTIKNRIKYQIGKIKNPSPKRTEEKSCLSFIFLTNSSGAKNGIPFVTMLYNTTVKELEVINP